MVIPDVVAVRRCVGWALPPFTEPVIVAPADWGDDGPKDEGPVGDASWLDPQAAAARAVAITKAKAVEWRFGVMMVSCLGRFAVDCFSKTTGNISGVWGHGFVVQRGVHRVKLSSWRRGSL
jgi:hypothetical protein